MGVYRDFREGIGGGGIVKMAVENWRWYGLLEGKSSGCV